MAAMRENRVSSMNSIKPSIILALLGKCRYKAASDRPTSVASLAVVILPPGLASSMRESLQDFGFAAGSRHGLPVD